MNREALAAIANSIAFECKKDGLQQRQSGDWMLRVVVQAVEMDQHIIKAPMGTRFQCVLVEINEDETPVDHKAMDRDKWRELGPVKQAALRCKDPIFRAYLRETYPRDQIEDEKDAAAAVRELCNVNTRSDLGKPGFGDQRLLWHDLDIKFQAWKALDRVA
jgi:hypothetical protein